MATAATGVATAIYKYTYTLGRSLYVPVTSRCNSVPLPATRGPNFLLPRAVAEGLVRVRNAETTRPTAADIDADADDVVGDWWAEEDEAVSLPPYDLPLVNSLYEYDDDDLSEHLRRKRRNAVDQTGDEIDDFLTPSIATLVEEVSSRLDGNANSDSDPKFDQVVIAGEGEPTLRMDALLAVARSVKSFRTPNDDDDDDNTPKKRSASRKNRQSNNNNNNHHNHRKPSSLPVRVITNGLCYGVPNFGYSPYNNERSGVIVPMQRHVILRDMLDAGISQLSVALNTANRHEYDLLMEPCCRTGGGMM
eukprot:CAMPEP_0196135970 /NCGR_PEP_ID=MMETSP0910-20130528/4438_1 /TAXON_ID=49265 /ORGANISM="Thalassiosira rotula, Strain GSO102" /LENGTH=305 /DNA_ID=CAMNT_0041396179 /DNA_START=84 /DNA_END=998 /DNA_ORIENTATION=+